MFMYALLTIYISPANSVCIKNNSECSVFESEKSIAKYSRLGEIIMMGDFNARKGKLSDLIDQYLLVNMCQKKKILI